MSQVMSERWERFATGVEAFREFDRETHQFSRVVEALEVPYFVNQFWTSAHRAAHSLHEVPYRACFKPQLPRFFIERLSSPGELVCDPYGGRGTTALEAALCGRRAMSNDVNPLSRILCEARLSPPSLAEVEQRLKMVDWSVGGELAEVETAISEDDLLVFYHPDTLLQLQTLRRYLLQRDQRKKLDHVDRWIQMVVCTRLSGHSSGMFSVKSLPPNQAVSAERQRKINQKYGRVPELKDVAAILVRKSRSLMRKLSGHERVVLDGSNVELLTGMASQLDSQNSSVDLVVTSPPFLDVVDYRADHWLRHWFCGIHDEFLPVGRQFGVAAWCEEFKATLQELKRVVRTGGMIVVEVGEIRRGKVLMEDWVVAQAQAVGLVVRGVLINDADFSKTAHCWGIKNLSQGTNTNRMVILEKS